MLNIYDENEKQYENEPSEYDTELGNEYDEYENSYAELYNPLENVKNVEALKYIEKMIVMGGHDVDRAMMMAQDKFPNFDKDQHSSTVNDKYRDEIEALGRKEGIDFSDYMPHMTAYMQSYNISAEQAKEKLLQRFEKKPIITNNVYNLDLVDLKALKHLQKSQPHKNWTEEKYYKLKGR